MKVILQDRRGRRIAFDDLSPLTRDEHQKLIDGDDVQYEGHNYVFRSWLDLDTRLYVEYQSWMELHPLYQLDQHLKRLGAKK